VIQKAAMNRDLGTAGFCLLIGLIAVCLVASAIELLW
jgi:hypothetical protein